MSNIHRYVECYKQYCNRCTHNTTSDHSPLSKECGDCIRDLFNPDILVMTHFENAKGEDKDELQS